MIEREGEDYVAGLWNLFFGGWGGKLSEHTMEWLPLLANHGIDAWGAHPGSSDEKKVKTIIVRLAGLIGHIEMDDHCKDTAAGTKWYLEHLKELTFSPEMARYIKPFSDRLSADLAKYESQYGLVDDNAEWFARLLQFAGIRHSWQILYGPPLASSRMAVILDGYYNNLAKIIQDNMWKQWP
jgi:hypothetical protein